MMASRFLVKKVMPRGYLFIFLIFTSQNLFSQDSVLAPKKNKNEVEIVAYGNINSNAITNKFARFLYKNEYIDASLKSTVSKRAKNMNRVGAFYKMGFSYSHQKDANKPIITFSFFDRVNFDSKFSKDLFSTIFFGNKLFEGKTAQMSDFKFNYLRYQQLTFGWKKDIDTITNAYGFSISLLSGQENFSIHASRANLFTANGGLFIDFDLAMKANQTNKANKHFLSNKGMGASLDLFFKKRFKIFKKQAILSIEANDLGFLKWNRKSLQYTSDSIYHYEGLYVNDIFNINTSASPINLDTIINKHAEKQSQSYSTYIPGTVSLYYNLYWNHRIMTENGLYYRFNSSANVFYYLKVNYLIIPKKQIILAYTLGYGDYGHFCSGLDFKITCRDKYMFQLAGQYLFSNLVSKSPSGMGVYFKMNKRF